MSPVETVSRWLDEHSAKEIARQAADACGVTHHSDMRVYVEHAVVYALTNLAPAALAKAERERAWLPIETAPKDGTQFLGIIEGGSGPCQVIVNWHPFGYWDCGLPCQILGWQPLPPLPSNEQVR